MNTQFLKINHLQHFTLFQTKARFYLAASNHKYDQYRILKIDRQDSNEEINLFEDHHIYSSSEFNELMHRINIANQSPQNDPNTSNPSSTIGYVGGLTRVLTAFGIVGFVRFLEGYYIVLITKRRKIAQLGEHFIYKVEETEMIYIPYTESNSSKHPDEARYVKLFQSVDLSSNFYFSYSYDLTHTLQYNMSSIAVPDNMSDDSTLCLKQTLDDRYVWNWELFSPFTLSKDLSISDDWFIPLIHGFIGQTYLSVFTLPVFITLIARRSRYFAGARFMKRGCNIVGDVANEVETEQIVHEGILTRLQHCKVSSYVQHRGSIPLFWTQEISKVVGKPPIEITRDDPYFHAFGMHFSYMYQKYGAPIVVLNLVKQRERRPVESLLSERYKEGIDFLNQFLPEKDRIVYVDFDMARVQKSSRQQSVLTKLAPKAQQFLRHTGMFVSFPKGGGNIPLSKDISRNQFGVVRTNCIDCLDRTNTGQFVIAQAALGHQLHLLGCLSNPVILIGSKIDRLLQGLFEGHGDVLALQYGGSQLVHNIETYRKTATLTSQSRDFVQTISRYYSNTFSDYEKQMAINVFLRVYQPSPRMPNIWDIASDSQMHWKISWQKFPNPRQPYTDWCSEDVVKILPSAKMIEDKPKNTLSIVVPKNHESVDWFSEVYPLNELTCLDDMVPMYLQTVYITTQFTLDFRRHFSLSPSPSGILQPVINNYSGSRSNSPVPTSRSPLWVKKPTSQSSSSKGSLPVSDSDSGDSFDSDSEEQTSIISGSISQYRRFGLEYSASHFQNASDAQDISVKDSRNSYPLSDSIVVKNPNFADRQKYIRYIEMSWPRNAVNQLLPISVLPLDSSWSVTPPTISKASREVYEESYHTGVTGIAKVKPSSLNEYKRYINMKEYFRV